MTQSNPMVPVTLGLAGLLPFLATSAAAAFLPSWQAVATLAAALYGIAILSFLGGIHWGRALTTGRAGEYVGSVVPSLVAVFAMVLPPPWALGVLSSAFAVVGAIDVALLSKTGPAWFARLRLVLTVVVVIALAVSAAYAPASGPMFGLLG
ncbi:DUF3429 domain-containing protein [Acuticoccus sp.]|uniref:DUF3429 domain-containing protein n=1 Tax=Acuticoccus sp. TaxID=1904378 RepID=UPI003B523D65